MKKLLSIALISLFVFSVGCSQGSSSDVLVKVNGTKITQGDLDFLSQINPRIKAQINSPMGKKNILNNLVEQELLYQDSVKHGLHRDLEVKNKIDLYRRVIISQAAMDHELEETAEKYYKDNKKEFEKLKLSHIYIPFVTPTDKNKKSKDKITRTEAKALSVAAAAKARVDKGEKFEDLCKEISEDKTSNNRNCDLGPVSIEDNRLVRRGFKTILDKAFTMKVGEISDPIKSDSGYHIITVTEGIIVDDYEKVAQGIKFKIQGQARNEYLASLKAKAKIKYPEEEQLETKEPLKEEAVQPTEQNEGKKEIEIPETKENKTE